jgi:hypothetical protein
MAVRTYVHTSVKELSARAKILGDGDPKLWSEFMEELRHLHMDAPAPRGGLLQAAVRLQAAVGLRRRRC